jgi:hypothetical protein
MSLLDPVALAKADAAYVGGNLSKGHRECWVLRRWLLARGTVAVSVLTSDDPPDLVVDGVGVEVVEALEPRRRRGNDYAGRVAAAKEGRLAFRKLPSLSNVQAIGHDWVHASIRKKCAKHYDSSVANQGALLVYVNFSWADRVHWAWVEDELAMEHPIRVC